jgi:hypothetical protein
MSGWHPWAEGFDPLREADGSVAGQHGKHEDHVRRCTATVPP